MKKMLFFLTNSSDVTCDYLCKQADENSLEYVRFDTDFSCEELSIEFNTINNIVLQYKGKIISPNDIKCIWNRRPEKIYAGNYNESLFDEHYRDEWRHAFDGFIKQISYEKWINHPLSNALALSKIEQLERAKKYGLNIPKTLVTQSIKSFQNFYNSCSGNVIIKPISHGYLTDENTVYNIYTNKVVLDKCSFEFLHKCPSLFQEKIHKRCDIRVSYIDEILEAVELKYVERGEQRLDIRKENMNGVEYNKISLPSKIETQLIAMIKSYNLRFAAIDLCITNDNEIVFFEINPNGQWAWMDILGVTNFNEKLLKCMSQ